MFTQKKHGEIYTKKDFGLDLIKILKTTEDHYKIGALAYNLYFNNMLNIEREVEKAAIALNSMEGGEEFHYTIDELYQIADELIIGQYPKLLK